MTTIQTEADILAATARQLSEQGYSVIVEPARSILPAALAGLHPDAVAIGREPKLVIEIAGERSDQVRRVAELQKALRSVPDWKLHLVLNRSSGASELTAMTDTEIATVLDRALEVARIDPRAALLMAWAALEALSRERQPHEFARPQSPGRIIESLASQGIVTASEARFLRSMADSRNAFVHGDLRQIITVEEVGNFVELLRSLFDSAPLRSERNAPAT